MGRSVVLMSLYRWPLPLTSWMIPPPGQNLCTNLYNGFPKTRPQWAVNGHTKKEPTPLFGDFPGSASNQVSLPPAPEANALSS
jgi:hypothetical protein